MKRFLIFFVILVTFGGGAFFFVQRTTATKEVSEEFTFEVLGRGNIQNLVSSTGTLSAVGTVNVGSQIAGNIDTVYVDYNDHVEKGQLLAVIDTTMLEASVRDAEANLAKSAAQLDQAKVEYQRNEKLFQDDLISELTYLQKKTSWQSAAASVKSAQASLERNHTNLKYAEIRSPITGTVLEKSVESGQTVSSGNSATELFIIAEDLATMQIEALVDESDIGQIEEGMPTRFTVQAYPDDDFTGMVRQIRLNPRIQQDVVSYTVIVDAQNPNGTLLPGMTATVDFVVEERFDVLLIPNTALYFQPSQEFLEALRQQSQAPARQAASSTDDNTSADGNTAGQRQRPVTSEEQTETQEQLKADGTNAGQRRRRRPADAQGQMPVDGADDSQRQRPANAQKGKRATDAMPGKQTATGKRDGGGNMVRVYYLDDSGNPAVARFTPGSTDGATTEVLQSAQLAEDIRVITGIKKIEKEDGKQSFLSTVRIPGLGGGGAPKAQGGGRR